MYVVVPKQLVRYAGGAALVHRALYAIQYPLFSCSALKQKPAFDAFSGPSRDIIFGVSSGRPTRYCLCGLWYYVRRPADDDYF